MWFRGGGLIKSSKICVMLHVSMWWQNTAQHSDPLNHALLLSTFLSLLIPSLHSPFFLSASPLPHATNSHLLPPFSSFSSSSSSSSSFCSFVLLWHIPQACWREVEGENRRGEDGKENEEKRGGWVSEKVRDWSAGHFFISLLWRKV